MDFVFFLVFFEVVSLRCMKDNDKVFWVGCEMVRLKLKRGKRCMYDVFIFIFILICSDFCILGFNFIFSCFIKVE